MSAAKAPSLTLRQKRQATLLGHWMSEEHLRQLRSLIDDLIRGADVTLDVAANQGRDALIADARWGVRDTAANWSTFVYPALEDFRKATVRDLARRAIEVYEFTGATQCARMIDEFSSLWMTEDEERRFKASFDVVFQHAQLIDFAAGVGGSRHQLNDWSMSLYWQRFGDLFPRLPKFQVRTDTEGVTGKRPPRTGVYVAQDDPLATLQFAWTGSDDGALGDAQTLNDIGRRAVAAVGDDAMWIDGWKTSSWATGAFARGELTDRQGFDVGDERDPRWVGAIIHPSLAAQRATRWYFVEPIAGESDDEQTGDAEQSAGTVRERCAAGDPCPREGYWSTPARIDSRRHFSRGEIMPNIGGDYGATIWQRDEFQA